MADVEWKGGRVLVSSSCSMRGGWSVVHLTVCDGPFILDWHQHKNKAIEMGRAHARSRDARLYVEEAL